MDAPVTRTAPPRPEPDRPGAARVAAMVPGSPAAVWAALTERDHVTQWFGNLSETLRPGGRYRLDFGDGDFFLLEDVALTPTTRLRYRWRFLGTAPQDDIAWTIEDRGAECRVTVTDFEASRSDDGVDEMVEGWTDFLQRLQAYCATGRNARYAWRKAFDGSIELAAAAADAAERLFSPDGQRRWLPWRGAALAAGTQVRMADRVEPELLTITEVVREPAAVRLSLAATGWNAATECVLRLEPWPSGSLLVVSHRGWDRIGVTDDEQAAQRSRFSRLWVGSLRAARALTQT